MKSTNFHTIFCIIVYANSVVKRVSKFWRAFFSDSVMEGLPNNFCSDFFLFVIELRRLTKLRLVSDKDGSCIT